MDRTFFEESEEKCYEKFVEWQNQTKFFNEFGRVPKCHWSDASGITEDDFLFNIELKDRDQVLCRSGNISGCTKVTNKTYKDNTIIIEGHKMADLLLDYINEGIIPLYMNFLHNDVVILYDLTKIKHPKKKRFTTIRSKGYGKMEADYRFELPLKDAAIFKAGKLVKKMGVEWNYEGMCDC